MVVRDSSKKPVVKKPRVEYNKVQMETVSKVLKARIKTDYMTLPSGQAGSLTRKNGRFIRQIIDWFFEKKPNGTLNELEEYTRSNATALINTAIRSMKTGVDITDDPTDAADDEDDNDEDDNDDEDDEDADIEEDE